MTKTNVIQGDFRPRCAEAEAAQNTIDTVVDAVQSGLTTTCSSSAITGPRRPAGAQGALASA